MPKGGKKEMCPTYDPLSDRISQILLRFPGIGKYISQVYLWRFCTFNFMIVGASGMLLSYFLYEGFFRIFMSPYPFGLFSGMLITTVIVFFWNYFWNKKWSLGISSQILIMRKDELQKLHEKVGILLKQKFDYKGERIHD